MANRLHDNLRAVRERIDGACARSGRPPGSVRLIAVTKGVPAELCAALAELGQLDLAENRAHKLAPKAGWCRERGLPVRWHFIGHLQRNKARSVVRDVDEIHSVDSARLLQTLERVAAEEGRHPLAYLEVDLAGVSGRTGLTPAQALQLAQAARQLEHVRLVGLMTMAPFPDAQADEPLAAARSVFTRLAQLREELDPALFEGGRCRLSMGMSSDLEAAVEAGADLVRVGTALFEGLALEPSADPDGGRA